VLSVELFRTTNIDWLGKKWYFLGFSLIFSVAGLLSILFWHHIPQGVDFKGGTQVRVAFAQTPNEDHVRQAIDRAGVRDFTIQRVSDPSGNAANKVIIAMPESSASDVSHDAGRVSVENALNANYHDSGFTIESVDIVGPTAGKALQKQALWATVYSLIGMLVYLWFRFELIYGVAAVVAVFHDTLITIGAFSLSNQEITLTVIAAILTLIGYGDLVGADLPDGALAVCLWRRGAAWVLVRAGDRDSDRDVFVDCRGGSDAGGVPGVAGKAGQDGDAAGKQESEGVNKVSASSGLTMEHFCMLRCLRKDSSSSQQRGCICSNNR
jgi:preprotein translocase SecF subunit